MREALLEIMELCNAAEKTAFIKGISRIANVMLVLTDGKANSCVNRHGDRVEAMSNWQWENW